MNTQTEPTTQQAVSWDDIVASVKTPEGIIVRPEMVAPMLEKKAPTLELAMEAYNLLPRGKARIREALPDDEAYSLVTKRTFWYLCIAARDPKADCSAVSVSKKIMFYNKLDKSWHSIAAATRMLGRDINRVSVDVKPLEPVHQFRIRLLGAIYVLVK